MKQKNSLKTITSILLSFVLIFAFSACSQNDDSSEKSDTSVDIEETINMVSGDYEFVGSSDNTVTIAKYIGKDINIEIPGEIDGKKVTAIGNVSKEKGAFQDRTKLVSVVIPDGVIEIQDNAFRGCTSLKTVRIPASVTSLGNCAFYNCPSLYAIYFKGKAPQVGKYVIEPVPYLDIYHYEGTEGWTNPWHDLSMSSYKESGEYYYEVNDDNTVTIIKYIGKGIDIVIPSEIDGMKVTTLGNSSQSAGAFQDCTTLTSVVISEGITAILDNSFKGCTSLNSVTIPASVTIIWHAAFDDSPNLQSIYFEGGPPQTGNYLFDYRSPLTIYYHEDADGWTNSWYERPTKIY